MSEPARPGPVSATPSRPAPAHDPQAGLPALRAEPRQKPFGDPAAWSVPELYRMAAELTLANPAYFLVPAATEAILALVNPLLCLVTGPVIAVLLVGGTADHLAGETPLRLGEVWGRHRARLMPMLGAGMAIGMLAMLLTMLAVLPGALLGLVPAGPTLLRVAGGLLALAGAVAVGFGTLLAGTFAMQESLLGERTAAGSIEASYGLVRRAPGAVLSTSLANGAIHVGAQVGSLVGVLVLGTPLAVVACLAGASEALVGWLMLPLQVLLTTGAALLANLTLVVSTLLYVRERSR